MPRFDVHVSSIPLVLATAAFLLLVLWRVRPLVPATVLAVRPGDVASPPESETVVLPAKVTEGPPAVVDTVKVTLPVAVGSRVGAAHGVLLASTSSGNA